MKISTRRRLRRAWRWLRHPLGLVGYGVIGVVTIAMMVGVARSDETIIPFTLYPGYHPLLSWNAQPDFEFDGPDGPVLILHLKERRIEVPPGVEADEAARAVLRAMEAYLPVPCKN